MFERFTQAAKDLVLEAQVQRRAAGDHRVGSEHLLLALLADPGPVGDVLRQQGIEADRFATRPDHAEASVGPATTEDDDQLLSGLGIDIDAIRRSIDETHGPGALDRARADRSDRGDFAGAGRANVTDRHTSFDSAAKRILELSLRESLRLKTGFIGPEHVGLGILRANESAAYQLLVADGVDVTTLRTSWETIALQAQGRSPRSLLQRLRS